MEWLDVILLAMALAFAIDCVWWYGTQRWPPSPMRIPLIGTPFHIFNGSYKSFTEMGKKYGGVFSLHLFDKHFVIVNDYRVMKEAIVDKAHVFSSRPDVPYYRDTIGLNGILFIDGPVWKEKRRFTIHNLRNLGIGKTVMEDVILDEISNVSQSFQSHFDGHSQSTVTINDLFFMSAVNVIWRTIGGKTYDQDHEEIKQLSDLFKESFARILETLKLNFVPFLKFVPFDPFHVTEMIRCTKQIFEIIEKQVDEHARTLKPLEEPRDFIDAYLIEIERKKAAEQQTGADVCYQKRHLVGVIFDMFQAGVETTTTTMEWALLYMAIWPHIQTGVQEEMDSVIGRNRKPRYSDNLELPYTRATIMEIQRYSTVIPMCFPRIAATAAQLDGHHVPKGAIIVQNLWAVHYDEAYWGDPDVFRPSRFIDEHGQVKKYENLIPFSTGPRACLGESLARMEVFLFFASMLHAYTFRCPAGCEPPSLQPVISLTLRPRPFKLIVKQRT